MRSRNRAAFSKSSASAEAFISRANRWRIARLRPKRKSRACVTSSAYSGGAISPVQGAEQRLIWNSRHGRVRLS
jgi:hypothetical protein